MRVRDIPAQLQAPDPLGRDLALLRTRLYRFSDDPRHYLLAEHLEDRYLDGHPPQPATRDYVSRCLQALRASGQPLPFLPEIADAEGLDFDGAYAQRAPFAYTRHLAEPGPGQVVAIVGAPRSGTSHLHNLLAYQQHFAYFTTATCWAWPTRNLHQPHRRLFADTGEIVFTIDNKRTRTIPALVMPGEAEDIYARAIPVYRHLGGHRYHLNRARVGDLDVLRGAVAAHLRYFNRPLFLTKSPFNSLRIPQLDVCWGNRVRYLHIVRDRHQTAASLARNRFQFLRNGTFLSPEETWGLFTDSVADTAPLDRLLTITHLQLLTDPGGTIAMTLAWLGIEPPTRARLVGDADGLNAVRE
ncbi:MAG TPA: sulfotransferase [Actinomycetes bacterium]|nr:sulfotransferase [Actinomycetes bacterium]